MTTRRARPAAALSAAAVLLGTAGCGQADEGSSGAPATDWAEPAAYTFTIDSRCGERGFLGTYRVRVEGGKVRGVETLDEAARNAAEGNVPTLAQVLAEYRRAVEAGAEKAEAEFDERDGHPVRIDVDPSEQSIDDEFCYRVTEYGTA